MKTYIRPYTILVLTSIFSITSCSKDEESPLLPDANCRIMTTSIKAGTNTTTYGLSYNNDGKVNKITLNDFYKTRYHFNYTAGEFVREGFYDHWSGQLTSHLHAELNGMGLPVHITVKRYDYAPVGTTPPHTSTDTYTYEYNGKGELQFQSYQRSDIKEPNNPNLNYEYTYTYTWSDGNMVKMENSEGGEADFEYYTDKPAQKGDYLKFSNLLTLGISEYKNKNLIKSITTGPTIINVNYEYDEETKVKSVTVTGSGIPSGQELKYQYSCN